MSIELTEEEEKEILSSIRKFAKEELDLEIGDMKAGFILRYFLAEIAPYAYNKGVRDSEQYFSQKVDDLSGTCYEPPLTYWTKKKTTRRTDRGQ